MVQPLARQLGLSILGTLDDRVGDTYEPDGCAVAPAPETSSVDLPTRKSGSPDQKAGAGSLSPVLALGLGPLLRTDDRQPLSGLRRSARQRQLGGFQGGIDLLRGSLIAGHYERAGLYGAYGDVNADVDGLVTNPAATAYILAHTGSMNLDAWSAGGYWTHVGPGGWYLDAVLQGTWYYGSASTQFARLNTDGTGFIASLEGGYSIRLAAIRAGIRDRAAGADRVAEGVVSGTTMTGLAMSRSATRRGRAGASGSGPNGRSRLPAVRSGSRISAPISGAIGGLRPTPSIRGRTSCRWSIRPPCWSLAAA